MTLISMTDNGLFCPIGKFYIDPYRGVGTAIITHAHADHAKIGSENYITNTLGVPILKKRIGAKINILGLDYGESIIINNVKVIPLPGPTAVVTALTGSGLPTDKFQFNGFLPKKNKELIAVLNKCANFSGTSVFYETPHRILDSLETINQIFSFEANLCVAKELTKVHENYFRGSAKEILDKFNANKQFIKGEFVLLIHFEKTDQDYSIADKAYKKLKSKVPIKELSKIVSDLTGINKNLLYKRFLSFSQKS